MIRLKNTVNVRDLGGYKTANNKITKHGVFYRSGNTDKSTKKDSKILINDYNLKTVIDLRSIEEIKKSPDKFASIQEVNYINTPIEYTACLEEFKTTNEGLCVLYFYILKEKKQVLKNIFDAMAEALNGAVLFHCTLGRDRTAVVAMFLLGLVGVNKKDIIENYTATYDLIKDLEIIKHDLVFYGERKTFTLPEYIQKAMSFVKENYSSFENYLLDCNVSQENLNKIKNKFLCDCYD